MKNKLLYVLIAFMTISLIGIISIQLVWISGAISEKKTELATHVNDALNTINDAIEEDESMYFIEKKLGGVDSLFRAFVLEESTSTGKEERDHLIIFNDSNQEEESESTKKAPQKTSNAAHTATTIKQIELVDEVENVRGRRLELRMENIDSILKAKAQIEEVDESKMSHVTSIVEHFTYEKLIEGALETRISPRELTKKIKKSLKKEGILSPYDYAVYNRNTKKIEKNFRSKGFQKNVQNETYTKQLFPSDKVKESNFELILQLKNESAYVWKEISQLALLSAIFTLFILLSFSYSLYFIYRQKKISQIKNDFINNMTHELKTPLATISLAAASIKHPEVIHNADEIRRFAGIIESEKQRMNKHIEQVLDLAALDKGEQKLNFGSLDLVHVVNAALKNVTLSLEQVQGHVNFTTDLDQAIVYGDAFHLVNVVTNILDNSIKYSKDNLLISVELRRIDKHFDLAITDNGIGMSASSQKLAFDQFYRAETGNIHNRKGFGLGLSYVKSTILAHKGAVMLTSDLGKGTTVYIHLPTIA